MILLGLLIESLVIFDVIRNQYFYFSEDLLVMAAYAVFAFIMLQLAAEVSEDGLEALTFGMMMTNWTCSNSFAAIIGNLVSAPFDVTS